MEVRHADLKESETGILQRTKRCMMTTIHGVELKDIKIG